MYVNRAREGATLAWLGFLLLIARTLSGCEDDAEPQEVPEVAEVRTSGGQVELKETFPLTPEDVGKLIYATGVVVGKPLPNGFFLRTEGSEVIFVESTQRDATPILKVGDTVRVTGPLAMATAVMFDEWEEDALESEIEAEWKVQPLWYIRA